MRRRRSTGAGEGADLRRSRSTHRCMATRRSAGPPREARSSNTGRKRCQVMPPCSHQLFLSSASAKTPAIVVREIGRAHAHRIPLIVLREVHEELPIQARRLHELETEPRALLLHTGLREKAEIVHLEAGRVASEPFEELDRAVDLLERQPLGVAVKRGSRGVVGLAVVGLLEIVRAVRLRDARLPRGDPATWLFTK